MASSSATISFCSLFANHCGITSHSSQAPLFKPSLSLSKPGPLFHSPCIGLSKPPLSVVTKFSETEAPVLVSQSDASNPEPSQAIEVSQEKPKREEVFAVVMIGGRQYIVFPGRHLSTQRLKDVNANDKIVLNKVLLVGTKTHTYIGQPVVTNAAVHAVVEEHGLNDKVVVFKYKPKKKYRRNIGHRQPNTRIRITGITGFEDYPAAANVAA